MQHMMTARFPTHVGMARCCLTALGLIFCACGTQSIANDDNVGVSEAALAQQPATRVYYAELADGVRTQAAFWDQYAEVSYFATDPGLDTGEQSGTAGPGLAPALETDLYKLTSGAISDMSVTVVVTFHEDQALPRFPDPDMTLPRQALKNQIVRQQADTLIRGIEQGRAPGLNSIASELRSKHSAVEVARFWLIKALTVRMPLSAIPALLKRSDVQHVEYDQTDSPPPQAGVIREGRNVMNAIIRSSAGWLGLIDTGVRDTHQLFNSPRRIDFWRDCVNGTSDYCSTGQNLYPGDEWSHGTSTANILSGNSRWGDDWRGITDIIIDSWKVYTPTGFNTSAGVRAFQAAVGVLDKVIVAEIQSNQGDTGSISTAADAAFDGGSVVVAAAGNYGEDGPGSVRAPGNARKALAVGAVDVLTLGLEDYSGRGPTSDNRIKPDVLGPTNVLAASTVSDMGLQAFGGTSCATPFVAGAAYNIRNVFFDASGTAGVEPGRVNALLLMTGPQMTANNDTGLGIPSLEPVGVFWNMMGDVTNGANVDLPFVVSTPINQVKVAIWWPEPAFVHNNIELHLIRPNGSTAASSTGSSGVFKKIRATTGLAAGTWKVRLRGASVTGTQRVYAAVHKR